MTDCYIPFFVNNFNHNVDQSIKTFLEATVYCDQIYYGDNKISKEDTNIENKAYWL